MPDTVRSRINLVVDMEAAPTRPDLDLFAGRYLNAVRVGATALAAAYSAPQRVLPNACVNCHLRSECFDVFGAVGTEDAQVGLYPFTRSALVTLARRSGAEDGEAFNPREFQKKVLKPILIDEAPDLANDRFPTNRFLIQMGGPEITNIDRSRLQERAGANFERYLAFYQLWNEGRLSGSSPGIMRAFGLEPLAGLQNGPCAVRSRGRILQNRNRRSRLLRPLATPMPRNSLDGWTAAPSIRILRSACARRCSH